MKFDLHATISELSKPLKPVDTGVSPVLSRLEGIRAVVFDIYGTLVCSGSGDIGLAQAEDREGHMRAALRRVGASMVRDDIRAVDVFHNAIASAQARRKSEGVDFPEVEIREVWNTTVAELTADGALQNSPPLEAIPLLSVAYECLVNPVWPMPGMSEALTRIGNAGLTMGIVSNAQFFTPMLFEALLEQSLDDLGFDRAARVYSYELREAKPSVLLYELVDSRLRAQGIEPHQVLYVGNDMRNDIWPAQKAGFKTALFAGDKRSLRFREDDPDVAKVQPTLVVTHLSQVADGVC